MKALHVGDCNGQRFTLPVDVVTQTIGILAMRGAGKTYTSAVIAEELIGVDEPVAIIDPLDVWWGLRSSADGKHPGLPVVVFGGSRADLPLSAADGKQIADALVDLGFPAVLSLRHLSNTDQRRFVGDFAERLYDRKGEPAHRDPLHVIIDEADAFVPQHLYRGSERCYGAVDALVRRGRSSGIGVTLISQRPAKVNKDVLTQVSVLIALRTVGPQDRKAFDAWIEAHDAEGRRDEFLGSLASLPIGTAWVWSPGWLNVFERVQVRKRKTFDSSATPKIGAKPIAPKKLADIDIESLRVKLGKAIEEAKANDPATLKRTIAELTGELRDANKRTPERHRFETANEIAKAEASTTARWRKIVNQKVAIARGALKRVRALTEDLTALLAECEDTEPEPAPIPTFDVVRPTGDVGRAGPPFNGRVAGERRILIAAAQHPLGVTKAQLAVLTGYKRSSRNTYIQRLQSAGLVRVHIDTVHITPAGERSLGSDIERLPTGDALRAHWLAKLTGGERELLSVICDAYPAPIEKSRLGDLTEYKRSSRNTYLQRLAARQLVHCDRETVTAARELFG